MGAGWKEIEDRKKLTIHLENRILILHFVVVNPHLRYVSIDFLGTVEEREKMREIHKLVASYRNPNQGPGRSL